jgi:topoisomerase IA-like protein
LTLALLDSIHSSTAKNILQNRCKFIERENRKMATKKAAKKAPAKKAAKKTAKKK